MNAAQQAALARLQAAAPGHTISERKGPGGTRVSCACGWGQTFPKVRSAFARKARQAAAVRGHLEAAAQKPVDVATVP